MARDWIKELRIKRFPNQAALAAAAGIKTSRYSRIEKGYCDIQPEEAEVLARLLETTVSFIEGKEESTKPVERHPSPVLPDPSLTVPLTATAPDPLPPQVEAPTVSKASLPEPRGLAAAQAPALAVVEIKNDDLASPAHFTLMPPLQSLDRAGMDEIAFRSQLQKHIAFATKVLHTSRVKPAVWAAWRNFEKEAQERLRGAQSLQAPIPTLPVAKPNVAPIIPIEEQDLATPSRRSGHKRNKNYAGHFFDAAKDKLPAETVEELVLAAGSAKTTQPEFGFMKHFVRLTEEKLPAHLFQMLGIEASRRMLEQQPPSELEKSG